MKFKQKLTQGEFVGNNDPHTIHTCEDLQGIEGCPKCVCQGSSARRARLDLGPRHKFNVCSVIGSWLLDRGVTLEELGK